MSDKFLNGAGLNELRNWINNKLTTKQDTLASGTNIKTINNTSLLGSGNISVQTPLSFDTTPTASSTNPVTSDGIKTYIDNSIPTQATETVTGTIKLNPSESITLNSNGQLDVGGRLGAFSGTTGIFHSKDREPRRVSDFSFLITDAKGMNLAASRDLAIATGVNLTLTKSHAAGSTTYTVSNTYANRIACSVLANGGYVAQNEA